MSLLDNWHEIAYDTTDQKAMKSLWEKYFAEEKERRTVRSAFSLFILVLPYAEFVSAFAET